MSTSTIPAVLAALVSTAEAALTGVQVGQSNLLETEPDFLIVAADDPENGVPGVTGVRSVDNAAGTDDLESYDVAMLLSSWTGDADVPTVQARLFSLLDTFDAALDVDRTLGLQFVDRVQVTDFALAQPIGGQGASSTLRFTVHVDAWRY